MGRESPAAQPLPRHQISPRFPIPDSRFPIPDSRFPNPSSRFPIPGSRFSSRGSSGFTLIEILAVIVLIAIAISAVAVTVGKSLQSAQVNAVSRDLAAALRYTRGQAIVKGSEQVIRFNLRDWSYKVPGKAAQKLPDGMELRIRTAAEEQIDKDIWGLRFYPDGSSTGGRITIIRGPREWHVNVSWLTGEVRVKEVEAG